MPDGQDLESAVFKQIKNPNFIRLQLKLEMIKVGASSIQMKKQPVSYFTAITFMAAYLAVIISFNPQEQI